MRMRSYGAVNFDRILFDHVICVSETILCDHLHVPYALISTRIESLGLGQASWIEKLRKALPWIGVVFLQLVNVGNTIITKAALSEGMHFSMLSCFRNMIASVALLPIVFIQRHSLPNMTMGIFLQILALGVLEPGLDQNFLYAGSKQTPAGFLSCMAGVRPALTFIAAWICSLETVRLNQRHSQAKLIGTIIMAGGAIIIGLYSGPTISSSFHSDVREQVSGVKEDYIVGSTYVFISVVSYVLYIILSGKVVMKYPAPLALTAYVCLTGAIIDTGVALASEVRRKVSWSIGWNITLLCYFYGGLVVSALATYVQNMVINSKGPVFVTAFSPLSMILAILFGLIVLGESVHLGSVIGAILIIGGLFTLLWGKSRREEVQVS
ncbi:WAT1-related protein [Camellia lanceoleosa]|nr:WAT1-related protein [Camellia lanceoleosa]